MDREYLQKELEKLRQETYTGDSFLALQFGPQKISNCAAQIAKYADGEELFSSACNRFRSQLGSPDMYNRMEVLGGIATPPITATRMAGVLDGVIWRRNNQHIHFANKEALMEEAQSCSELLKKFPLLRKKCWWESWIVDHRSSMFEVLRS